MEKSYVISAELDLLAEDSDSVINRENIVEFRESLDADLRNTGKKTEWVDSSELRDGIATLLSRTSLPVISLDDRYMASADAFIGISRGVDDELNDAGYVPRVGYPSIIAQLDAIQISGNEAIIADDVIFTGEMLAWLREELLYRRKIRIVGVMSGIAIGEGAEMLSCMGITVDAVKSFGAVEDEICERDFAVVSGSGRRIASTGSNALYFDSVYGRPEKWASIPSNSADEFAANSYDRSSRIIKPGVMMKDIGSFKGLENGAAQAVLQNTAQRFRGE